MRFILFSLLIIVSAACGEMNTPDTTNADVQPTSTPVPTLPPLAVMTHTVQRGDVTNTLEFQGRWLPRDQNPLAFETTGMIRRVLVQRGDTVSAGQLLADLDITSLENSLAAALIDLESALATANDTDRRQSIVDAEVALANANLALETVRVSSPWQSGQNARLGVEQAERGLENAQRAYDDAISRPENPASVVDAAYQAVISAQDALRSARISVGAAGQSWASYEIQLQQAENAVIQSEQALEQARANVGTSNNEQTVRSAQLRVDQLRADIARSSLYSPIDGVVLEIIIQPGAQAEAFRTVITVGIPEPLEAIANVSFNDSQRMGVGLVGVCNVLNQPDTAVHCIARRLPLTPQDADQTVRVAATLPEIPAGQIIQITMPLETRTNVLWLPPNAIRTFQSRTFILLETPEGQRRVDIQIGLRTNDRVEIVSGLNEGDVVVMP